MHNITSLTPQAPQAGRRRWRILIAINNLSNGGAERLVVDHVTVLGSWGHDVGLVTLRKAVGRTFNDLIALPDSRFKRYTFRSMFDVAQYRLLIRYLRAFRPDAIISHLYFSNTVLRICSLLVYPRPIVITYEHNVYTTEKNTLELTVDRLLAHASSRIIGVSRAVKEYLIREGISPTKIDVVVNGFDMNRLSCLEPQDTKRAELGFSRNDFVFVAVGNVHQRKGHDLLLEAFARIADRLPSGYVLICGNDKNAYAESLKLAAKDKGLSGRFVFLGARADVLDIVNACDVFLMPSRYEGLGTALLEAMAIGKPIVVSAIPAFAELVVKGDEALVFESGDVDALAERMMEIYEGAALRCELMQNAKKRAAEFSMTVNVQRLLEVLTRAEDCPG